MAHEFEVIARYFTPPMPNGVVGGGDDCAYFSVSPQHQLATSADLLLEGRHFFPDVDPYLLGRKSLAVNLSDLAAAGARPLGCLLSLGLPTVNHEWLAAFSRGFLELAAEHGCPLIGGDTTRSKADLTIGVTVFGEVPNGQAPLRSRAQAQDDIWLTGELGAADVALRYLSGEWSLDGARLAATRSALENPHPPVQFAQYARPYMHAAIDVSDGLAQDLTHILTASNCGAQLWYEALPIHAALLGLDASSQQAAVLAGGDMFQLCFTAPATHRDTLQKLAQAHGILLSRIGCITASSGLQILDAQKQPIALTRLGFNHFSAST